MSQETRHTPGPWVVRHNDSGDLCVCTDEIDPWWVAEMCLGAGFDVPEPAEANARLIAAAPELLAALKECLHLAGRSGPPNEIDACNEIERIAGAAIDKATPPEGNRSGIRE